MGIVIHVGDVEMPLSLQRVAFCQDPDPLTAFVYLSINHLLARPKKRLGYAFPKTVSSTHSRESRVQATGGASIMPQRPGMSDYRQN
jgi:hypothetical protein